MKATKTRITLQDRITLVLQGKVATITLSGRQHEVWLKDGVVYAKAFKAGYIADSDMFYCHTTSDNGMRFNEAVLLCRDIIKQMRDIIKQINEGELL